MASYEQIKARIRNADPAVVAQRTRWFLLASILLTALLYVLPYYIPETFYIALPLIWLSTLVHELGHGITAAVLGGNFEKFVMYPDASGAATWSAGPFFGPLRRALVAAGGLVGPAVVAAASFALARKPKTAQYVVLGAGLALVLAAALVVRNVFGLAFVLVLAAILGILGTRERPEFAQLGLVFLATQLALSVYSRGDYLFTEYAETAEGRMPSDVAQMSEALFAPYWVWGSLCAVFSAAVLCIGLWIFFKGFDNFKMDWGFWKKAA